MASWVDLWNGHYAVAKSIVSETNRAPVGTEVTFHGTDILRLLDGQVVEDWLNADTLDLMTQLRVGAS